MKIKLIKKIKFQKSKKVPETNIYALTLIFLSSFTN